MHCQSHTNVRNKDLNIRVSCMKRGVNNYCKPFLIVIYYHQISTFYEEILMSMLRFRFALIVS